MEAFEVRGGETHCESVALRKIAAEVGTPVYVYSKSFLRARVAELRDAFAAYPTQICYAVKANSNLSVLREIFQAGTGADIVSVGELERALKAGVNPLHVVYSGVGKRDDEILRAMDVGILSFNVESAAEIDNLARLAKARGKKITISLRLNPNISVKTNPKIATGLFSTKFGLVEDEALELAHRVKNHPHLQLRGVGCHLGSQILDLSPMAEAAQKIVAFAQQLMNDGHKLEFIDMGGGLGINYKDEVPPSIEDYAKVLIEAVKPTGLKLLVEPGRWLVGNCGVLLNTVMATKKTPKKNFLIVDGAMNDLMRPAMYDAYHGIFPVKKSDGREELYDVVGPVCETGDIFGEERSLPHLNAGDLVYIRSAGAYGASMASNYNTRARPAEVLVDGDRFQVVRKRETLEDLWRDEQF
ncbi:MAG: diaminopimelate decarboxylase [Proteobacteria bacterium]|nr:MAG: diaminopimelate decarboxylase [Pseudomonadota bacterium]